MISGKTKSYIIAEIGNNHNGDIKIAKEMALSAKHHGADCVKFQMRQVEDLYRSKKFDVADDLGVEYHLNLLDKFNLSNNEHKELYDYCNSISIDYMCTPWEKKSVHILSKFGVKKFKIASADLLNFPLLDEVSLVADEILISTGMATKDEIISAIDYLSAKEISFTVLHCNSTYPAPYHDINLNWMKQLQKLHLSIGYSGHERGYIPTLGAIVFGAKVIERHFTFDKDWEGPDHAASLLPSEFKEMVDSIRIMETSLGKENKIVTQGELLNKENLAKSIIAKKNIFKGEVFSQDHFDFLSPGNGLGPNRLKDLIGQIANRNILPGEFLYESDTKSKQNYRTHFNFDTDWGIPVRYHDFDNLMKEFDCDFVEFHLSFTDLEADISSIFQKKYDLGAYVHAPELLAKSKLMDLTVENVEDHFFQIQEFQKIINISRDINNYFSNEKNINIICNIGGFSRDRFLNETEIEEKYSSFSNNLKLLDCSGVNLLPQTMAPFPWHFGGQRYQNLFLIPDDIIVRCNKYNLKVCVDVSHTFLTCNYFKLDFYKEIEKLLPVCSYLHLGDSLGLNGEGMQIDTGEIDFVKLTSILKGTKIPFIPEIWQGHKEQGLGFKIALSKLEKYYE